MKKLLLLSFVTIAALCTIAAEQTPPNRPNAKTPPVRPAIAERMRNGRPAFRHNFINGNNRQMFALIRACKNDPSDANLAALQKFLRAEKQKKAIQDQRAKMIREKANACKCNCSCNKPLPGKDAKKACVKAPCKDTRKPCAKTKAPCKAATKKNSK